ncbi:NUDIX hydrolase domain-like protein [Cubamyces menziesii]|uniref:NAD(+) diphosphatase n=1 Tax=Trametes cubensis TaxID=1111947 RepID=A0AAD7TXV5_9APHY|nr:NUDIX hydrolase domain-like protein [Cubamyces menziesii]KAJ8483507.1 hypothetical protein ONZ51_g4641 [Trametes cubensis]
MSAATYSKVLINRLSWLRSSSSFLNAVVSIPATRWLVFKEGQPLLQTQASTKQSLARLTTNDVRPLLGPEPFFSQGQNAGELAPADVPKLAAARLRGTPVVFLGLHETGSAESANALPSSDFSAKASAETLLAHIDGTPYFSLDVSDVAPAEVDDVLHKSAAAQAGAELSFSEPRAAMGSFDAVETALFAEARSITDWNARNKHCPACGSPVYSIWAGWKLSCSSLLPWADNTGRKPCPTARGLHNFEHPRTDAVVVMAVLDESGDKILLGRNKPWPQGFYSCLSGFLEPGESFEDAVKRELWEEAGIKVWNVRYHSTLPWPFPSTLLTGFYATASSAEPLRTDLDNELEEARWYTREAILNVLNHTEGRTLTRRDQGSIFSGNDDSSSKVQGDSVPQMPTNAPPFKLPPLNMTAGVLISEWAHGRAGF